MRFTATKDQVSKMGVLAINASVPMGMGFLHATAGDYSLEELEKAHGKDCLLDPEGNLFLDYFEGRMVKLSIRKAGKSGNVYETRDVAHPDYQSWCKTYETPADLVKAAGGKVLDEQV